MVSPNQPVATQASGTKPERSTAQGARPGTSRPFSPPSADGAGEPPVAPLLRPAKAVAGAPPDIEAGAAAGEPVGGHTAAAGVGGMQRSLARRAAEDAAMPGGAYGRSNLPARPFEPAPPQGPSFHARLIAELPRLRRYAIAWLGSIVIADALVQACLERAQKQRDEGKRQVNLTIWLFALLHRVYAEVAVRPRPAPRVSRQGLEEGLLAELPAVEKAELQVFAEAMRELPEEPRRLLLLVALEGLGYREIADVLNMPVGTVMARLARAREQLKELLSRGTMLGKADTAA